MQLYVTKQRVITLLTTLLLAAGCIPGSSGSNNGGGNNGDSADAVPLAERAPCQVESYEADTQKLQATTVNSFGERGQVVTTEWVVEADFEDQFDPFTATYEYDELGRMTQTVYTYEGVEPDRKIQVRNRTYIDDTDRVDVRTDLRGPTVEDAMVTRTSDYQYDLEGNLIRLERSESADGGGADVRTYTYNEEGVRVSGQWLDSDEMKLADIVYEYDANGFLAVERYEFTEEIGGGTTEDRYERDELGRQTRHEYYSDSELLFYTLSTYACHESEG